MPELRIAVTGSAGVGKTTLAVRLAERLGTPLIEEEMRAHLERGGASPADGSPAARRALLELLWERRDESEQGLGSFVADTAGLDFTAHALFQRVFDGLAGCSDPPLLRDPVDALVRYDAVVLLPWGVVPYEADGVRPESGVSQLGMQLLLEGLLTRHLAPERLLRVPHELDTPRAREDWVLDRLVRAGWWTGSLSAAARNTPSEAPRRKGRVDLVGAGPGHPELLTVRARRLLRQADVVAYDKLVPPAIVTLCRPDAERLAVGHRGRGLREGPDALHPVVLDRARRGLHVVRLKSGDPFIFGRGGEEAEVLRREGIPYEVVPGITAALGAAAHAGIPLTQRGVSASVTLSTGHRADTPGHGELGTQVLYMGAQRIADNVAQLLAKGYAPETPAACVASATRPEQRVLTTTLAGLVETARSLPAGDPVLVIVGDVVGLHERLDWRRSRPLAGRRIVVGRTRLGPSALAALLVEQGAEVLQLPELTLSSKPAAGVRPGDLGGSDLGTGDRPLVFTCQHGVDAWFAEGRDIGQRPVWAIGQPAGRALDRRSVRPAVRTEGACAEAMDGIAEHLRATSDVSLVSSVEGRPALVADLLRFGVRSHELPVYSVQRSWPVSQPAGVSMVVLPSSGAARAVYGGPWGDALRALPAAAIGPLTAEQARRSGVGRVISSETDTLESLVDTVCVHIASAGVAEEVTS